MVPTADAHAQYTQWKEWTRVSCKQRLLTACFILEAQQATLLGRKLLSTVIHGFELPLPSHISVWEAESAPRWTATLQQNLSTIRYVYEISLQCVSTDSVGSMDAFQSALLIFTHYDALSSTNLYFNHSDKEGLSLLIDTSFHTQFLFLTAQLAQAVPIFDFHDGDSWGINEKTPLREQFELHEKTVAAWASKMWLSDCSSDNQKPVEVAAKLSSKILRLVLDATSSNLQLAPGMEMGLYFSALVLRTVAGMSTTCWRHSNNTEAPAASASATSPSVEAFETLSPSQTVLEKESFKFFHLASTLDSTGLPASKDDSTMRHWQDGIRAVLLLLAQRFDSSGQGASSSGGLLDTVVGVLRKLADKPTPETMEMF